LLLSVSRPSKQRVLVAPAAVVEWLHCAIGRSVFAV
jgi:hypothetical protein